MARGVAAALGEVKTRGTAGEIASGAPLPRGGAGVYKRVLKPSGGSMSTDASSGGRLDIAIRRLERATTMLEQRLAHRLAEAGAEAGGLFDLDRARLAADLDAARARERQLEAAGAEASAALAAAIAEIKSALGQEAS